MGFIKKIFGPFKSDIWAQVAKDVGGDFQKGILGSNLKIRLKYKNWNLLLDTFNPDSDGDGPTYTRLRVIIRSKSDLKFQLYNESILSPIAKFMGAQDIQIGNEKFDQNFMIKGNDPSIIKTLFSHPELKLSLLRMDTVHLQLMHKTGLFGKKMQKNEDYLYFDNPHIGKSRRDLNLVFTIFKLLLDEFVELGITDSLTPDQQFK